jgi:hypothetical protein
MGQTGQITALTIAKEFTERGYQVFFPLGEGGRVDLIVIKGDKTLRIQCKTGNPINRVGNDPFTGSILFQTSSSGRTYVGEVDYIAVHCSDSTYRTLLCPPEMLPKTEARLRATRPLEKKEGVLYASDFDIDNVLEEN